MTNPDDEERTPPIGDPIWETWSKPLLRFLADGPRTWDEIHAWRLAVNFKDLRLRHCIAWLEDRRLAKSLDRDGVVTWVAQSWFSTRQGEAVDLDMEEPSYDPLDDAMSLEGLVDQDLIGDAYVEPDPSA